MFGFSKILYDAFIQFLIYKRCKNHIFSLLFLMSFTLPEIIFLNRTVSPAENRLSCLHVNILSSYYTISLNLMKNYMTICS